MRGKFRLLRLCGKEMPHKPRGWLLMRGKFRLLRSWRRGSKFRTGNCNNFRKTGNCVDWFYTSFYSRLPTSPHSGTVTLKQVDTFMHATKTSIKFAKNNSHTKCNFILNFCRNYALFRKCFFLEENTVFRLPFINPCCGSADLNPQNWNDADPTFVKKTDYLLNLWL